MNMNDFPPLAPAPPAVLADQEAAVQRGALVLDEAIPGWWDRIDLDRLRLSSAEQCVLGQIGLCPQTNLGGYYEMLAWLHDEHGHPTDRDWENANWPRAHGFYASAVDGRLAFTGDDRWEALDKAWVVVILDRRAVAAAQR